MKVTVNVDCTPDEARTFMGLPDVKPMQEALLKDLEDQLRANISAMSPESMMKTWLPTSMQGSDGTQNVQSMFWNQMQQAMSGVMNTANSAMTNAMMAPTKDKDS